jgi:hypothetical protein
MTDLERLRQRAAGDLERHERQLEVDRLHRLAALPAEVAKHIRDYWAPAIDWRSKNYPGQRILANNEVQVGYGRFWGTRPLYPPVRWSAATNEEYAAELQRQLGDPFRALASSFKDDYGNVDHSVSVLW